jgi:hypothetical protein
MSNRTITGTLRRKTDPHQKYSSIRPPMSGPIAPPSEKLMIHTLMAVVRWRGSRNMLRMSESVDGATVAPATPSSARVAMSMEALLENAASIEAPPKKAAPISNSRRRPMRSPSVPAVISEPATRKP